MYLEFVHQSLLGTVVNQLLHVGPVGGQRVVIIKAIDVNLTLKNSKYYVYSETPKTGSP